MNNQLNNANSTNFTSQAMTSSTTRQEQENANQWPPVDLYTQIDALIQNSGGQQASGSARNEEVDSQTILQTILRQASSRR